ncbi:uncharacterized protein PRCAT00006271001 [Priceomyces carsonii]|uniref:uncharacterized protein n=1 Tax=Priceomyces carsonii TaxID=28549 RepID=UPI002ED7F8FD|nr:unnamed protein product [Priceomyces carsonii]
MPMFIKLCVQEAQGPNTVPIHGTFNDHDGVREFLSILSDSLDTEGLNSRNGQHNRKITYLHTDTCKTGLKKTNRIFKSGISLVCKTEEIFLSNSKCLKIQLLFNRLRQLILKLKPETVISIM